MGNSKYEIPPGGVAPGERRDMKVKDVLAVWNGWDSPDIFEVRQIHSKGYLVSRDYMSGVELIKSCFGGRELKRFGSFGRQLDGTWKHYIEVASV